MSWFKKAAQEEPEEIAEIQFIPIIRAEFHLISEKWAVAVELLADNLDVNAWMEVLSKELEEDNSLWIVDRFGRHWMFYKPDIKYFTLESAQAVTRTIKDSHAESI